MTAINVEIVTNTNGIARDDGLLHDEGAVMDSLVAAWNQFTELPVQHEDDEPEFLTHIHAAQHILALRIARRSYPNGWTHGPL